MFLENAGDRVFKHVFYLDFYGDLLSFILSNTDDRMSKSETIKVKDSKSPFVISHKIPKNSTQENYYFLGAFNIGRLSVKILGDLHRRKEKIVSHLEKIILPVTF